MIHGYPTGGEQSTFHFFNHPSPYKHLCKNIDYKMSDYCNVIQLSQYYIARFYIVAYILKWYCNLHKNKKEKYYHTRSKNKVARSYVSGLVPLNSVQLTTTL